jgi:hypothetical protein
MPMSFYFGGELDGVQINRVIWNGRSIPEHPPKISKEGIPPCPDRAVFDQVIPRDGDELTVIPAMGIPIAGGVIYGLAIGSTVIGVSETVLTTVAIFAASLLVNTIVSYLTAPSKPKGQGMTGPSSYGWQGYSNSTTPGGPIPVIFGVHKAPVKIHRGEEQ